MGEQASSGAALGFTLLELLIALAIGAAVVLGVYAAVGVTVDVASRGSDRTDEVLKVEAARQTIRRWLEAAYLPPNVEGPGFEGAERNVFGEPLDELTFLTLDRGLLGSDPGASARIRLRVDPERGLLAEHEGPDAEREVLRLLPEVRGLSIRYRVRLGDEVRWFEGWSSRVRLPVAVEIRFLGAAPDSLQDLVTAPLLVALPGNG
ncbi:MAG: prepilin-type N-terminal cleavage/methylation domain-containing protein [Gemmatimonadota bacterium]